MGDFEIKANLTLDTSHAEKDIESLEGKEIKLKAGLELKEVDKNLNNIVNKAQKQGKDTNKLLSSEFSKSMNKDLNAYRTLLQKKETQERKYLKNNSEKQKKAILSDIERTKDAIQKKYHELNDKANRTGNDVMKQSLNALTDTYLGKDAFNVDRSAKNLLNDWKQIGSIIQDSRNSMKDVKGDFSKGFIQDLKRKNDTLMSRYKDAKIHEGNREKYEREATYVKQKADEARRISRAEQAFDNKIRRARMKADEIEAESKRKLAHSYIDELANSKNYLTKNMPTQDLVNGFERFSVKADSLPSKIANIRKEQLAFARDLTKTRNDAVKLTQGLEKIDADVSGKHKVKYLQDVGKIIKSINNDEVSPKVLSANKQKINYYKQQKSLLGRMNTLENSTMTKYSDVQQKLDGFVHKPTISRATNIGKELENSFNNINTGKISSTYKNMQKFNRGLKDTRHSMSQLSSLDSSISRLSMFEQSGSLKVKDINKLRQAYADLSKSKNLGTGDFTRQLSVIDTRAKALTNYRTKMDNLKKDFKASLMGSSLGYLTGYGLRIAVGQAIKSYRDLDASMVNIKKVADDKDVKTVEQIRGITKHAIRTAKEVGASSSDVQNAIATSIQSGMGSMKASMAVARKSMILSNIGDMDKDESTKAINTIVKSYNLDPLKKRRIMVKGLRKDTDDLTNALDLLNHAG